MLRVRYPKASVITRRSKKKHSALFSEWTLLVWKKISFSYGPQTVNHISGTEERYSNSSNRTITKMGITARRVPICSPRTNIEYRSTTKHANADCLSRLPIHRDKANEEVDEVRLITLLQSSLCQWISIKFANRHAPIRFCQEYYSTWWQVGQISKLHRKSHCILANVTKLQSKIVVYCGEFE